MRDFEDDAYKDLLSKLHRHVKLFFFEFKYQVIKEPVLWVNNLVLSLFFILPLAVNRVKNSHFPALIDIAAAKYLVGFL